VDDPDEGGRTSRHSDDCPAPEPGRPDDEDDEDDPGDADVEDVDDVADVDVGGEDV
jgi:hypothetical protein